MIEKYCTAIQKGKKKLRFSLLGKELCSWAVLVNNQ